LDAIAVVINAVPTDFNSTRIDIGICVVTIPTLLPGRVTRGVTNMITIPIVIRTGGQSSDQPRAPKHRRNEESYKHYEQLKSSHH
jgi:hypothetical protein